MKTLLILCGGRGKRLGAITRSTPKPLIRIAGRPFIEHLLGYYGTMFDRIVLLAGYQGEKFMKYAGGKVSVVIESGALGTGGAVLGALDELPERFYLCNGDTFLENADLQSFFDRCEAGGRTTLLVARGERRAKGSVELEGGKVKGFAEKGASGEGYAYGGFSFILKEDLRAWRRGGGVSLEKDMLPVLAKQGKLRAFASAARIYDIGTPRGIARFKTALGGNSS